LKRNKIPSITIHCFCNFTDFSSDDFHVSLFQNGGRFINSNLLPLMTAGLMGYFGFTQTLYYLVLALFGLSVDDTFTFWLNTVKIDK
jgi:hypothetical protein